MADLHFCDTCPLCQPALVDPQTGRVVPDDDPTMQLVLALWWSMSREVRRAFIYVTVHNSRNPDDLRLADYFATRIEQTLRPH